MALYTGIYSTLKTADATNATAIEAAAAQACRWDAPGLAQFCALMGPVLPR